MRKAIMDSLTMYGGTEHHFCLRVVGSEAECHTLTEVHCPLGGDVHLVSLPINER